MKENYFMGMDGFVWFTGVVEDRNDPSKLGRVKVRCHTQLWLQKIVRGLKRLQLQIQLGLGMNQSLRMQLRIRRTTF